MLLEGWEIVLLGLGYVAALFAIATWADRQAAKRSALHRRARPIIYSLSLAVYCTSWTYFGSVGVAARSGFDFIPVYLGPILVFALGTSLISRVAVIARRQNAASIADFLAARYGKNQLLGGLVAIIAVIGIIPYISIQLKALSFSVSTMMTSFGNTTSADAAMPTGFDIALPITLALAAFAILFGTRHIDATEHQDGMITAIATESIVKLVAFLVVGIFVTFSLAGGPAALLERLASDPQAQAVFSKPPEGVRWLTVTLLSACAIMLLPRQFHVAIVENANVNDIRRAAWTFPIYLIAINIFVLPIALFGLTALPGVDADTYVLSIPVAAGNLPIATIAFIGGVSAATAMVIVESIALAIMISNNVAVPLMLRRLRLEGIDQDVKDLTWHLVITRRIVICVILALAYAYYAAAGGSAALAQTGLISFAAVAQFAPAFFGALLWQRGTAYGAMAGISAGVVIWAYTLLIPSFVDSGWITPTLLSEGPFGLAALRPRQLFGLEFEALTHGVFWSLAINISAYITVSMLRQPSRIEQIQALAFVNAEVPRRATTRQRLWRSSVTFDQVQDTVARYVGQDRTRQAFQRFAEEHRIQAGAKQPADVALLNFAETLLASAVGPASSRLIIGLLLERTAQGSRGAIRLLDDASVAIQHNRELLQSAIENVPQGIAVFDNDDQLICWNLPYLELLDLSPEFAEVGVPLKSVVLAVLSKTARGQLSSTAVDERIDTLKLVRRSFRERMVQSGKVLDIHSGQMPNGGLVVTFADVTETVVASEALEQANALLEKRVAERTAQLTQLNTELIAAKAAAEDANVGKTRFVAAASHDILQPLNAARLFTSTLVERQAHGPDIDLVRNVDASLEAVEDIFSTVLDMSRLDAGAIKAEYSDFRLQDLFDTLVREFSPIAQAKGLTLVSVKTSAVVRSDRRLLRRVLQNLVSNAIKYTPHGKVLMGCRRREGQIVAEIIDTGPGIPPDKHAEIFREFERLDMDHGETPGLGLGLSIVERMCKVMNHHISIRSRPGRGTAFSVVMMQGEMRKAGKAAAPQPVALAVNSLEGLTILAIDNEAAILDGLTALFAGWGITTIACSSAADALKACKTSGARIHAIVADYHINKDDGITLIESIRRETGRQIPAILITADRSRTVQELAAKANVFFLKKPVKAAPLRALLARLSATHSLAAE